MKQVIFFHGEKGGVGKSQALIWFYENASLKGHNMSIIETDRLGDVAKRYKENATIALLEVSGDKGSSIGLSRMFNALEEINSDIVLINLPGAASAKVEPHAEEIKEALDSMECDMGVIFIADSQKHSLTFLRESQESGIFGLADKKAVVFNGLFGVGIESWPVTEFCKTMDVNSYFMPEIDDHLAEIARNTALPLSEFIESGELNLFEKVKVKKWIKSADTIVDYFVEE